MCVPAKQRDELLHRRRNALVAVVRGRDRPDEPKSFDANHYETFRPQVARCDMPRYERQAETRRRCTHEGFGRRKLERGFYLQADVAETGVDMTTGGAADLAREDR
jgi:hypothetical protein